MYITICGLQYLTCARDFFHFMIIDEVIFSVKCSSFLQSHVYYKNSVSLWSLFSLQFLKNRVLECSQLFNDVQFCNWWWVAVWNKNQIIHHKWHCAYFSTVNLLNLTTIYVYNTDWIILFQFFMYWYFEYILEDLFVPL